MAAPAPLVLAVDDDPTLRELLRDVLAGEGYRVHTRAEVRPEDVALIAPDVLVLDHGIDRDGRCVALLEALRRDPVTAELPTLILTGAVQQVEQEADRLAALGVGVLLKPFDLEDLLERVAACLIRGCAAALSA